MLFMYRRKLDNLHKRTKDKLKTLVDKQDIEEIEAKLFRIERAKEVVDESTIDKVIKFVSKRMKVTEESLYNPKLRSSEVLGARRAITYLLRNFAFLTYEDIAYLLNTHHSSSLLVEKGAFNGKSKYMHPDTDKIIVKATKFFI